MQADGTSRGVDGDTFRQNPGTDAVPKRHAVDSAGRSTGVAPILLTDAQAAECMGISRRKFHELRDEPWMEKPIVLGPRLLRWSRAALEAAIANMPRQQSAEEPPQLRRARIEGMKKGAA